MYHDVEAYRFDGGVFGVQGEMMLCRVGADWQGWLNIAVCLFHGVERGIDVALAPLARWREYQAQPFRFTNPFETTLFLHCCSHRLHFSNPALSNNTHTQKQVKTTQPRRYLVRPNQGIVTPNSTETISILLVDKDRQVLYSTYERLGQSALDHSKDKFLVQSCAVSEDFSGMFRNEPRGEGGQYKKELVEALTGMWNGVASGSGNSVPVFNKKLHVRHVVDDAAVGAGGGSDVGLGGAARGIPSATGGAGGTSSNFQRNTTNNNTSTKDMTPSQLNNEVEAIRRKYDELVAFSVNLTAERDILNNTLEQTKRDLNREMASRQALEKQGYKVGGSGRRGGGGGSDKSKSNGGGISFGALLVTVVVVFFAAVRATNVGSLGGVLGGVPFVGGLLGFDESLEEGKKTKFGGGAKDEL